MARFRVEGHYFVDNQGFTYVFPDLGNHTMYIGGSGSKPWRRLVVGCQTWACGTFTQEMYDELREEAVKVGIFIGDYIDMP